ncbi:MAG: xanthine dehydrogenase family protein [Desulfobacteraceae bacterium]|nr:xanthine dehydrogenase family protein [Desulfobacteraceae bacterium]
MAGVFEQIARDIPKIGAVDSSRGRTLFSEDVPIDDPLVLRVFRSKKAHAEIINLDVKRAGQIPGVIGVLTAADIPGKNLFGLINKDQPLLAHDKVRFEGEAIALVAAENDHAAQQAVDAVQVNYQELPPVFDMERALDQDATPIHEGGNLLFRRTIRKGDAAEGLLRSHVVVQRCYQTSHLEHAYLEPDAGAGYLDEDGTLVIYASTQNPHYDHGEVCQILGLEEERVRIIQAATGGGFGSKLDLTAQGFIGLALFHFQRPVRLVYTREESFLSTSKRHPFIIRMESGAEKDGRLSALRVKMICDTGAYASYGLAVATRAAVHVTGPYEVENVEVECLCVYTNHPVAGAMRGFGVPQVAIAHESQIDILAEELGFDPLEMRRINALRPGSLTATGQELTESVGILKTLDAIEPYYRQAKGEWKENGPSSHLKRGVGLGVMYYGIGNTGVKNPSGARIQMNPEGRVTLYTGAADIGQGSTTALAQIASEVLGIDPLEIELVVADTKWTTSAGATSASRQTYISGNAVKEAALKLADILLSEAEKLLETPKDFLSLKEGLVVDSRDIGKKASLGELATQADLRGTSLSCPGNFDPVTTTLDPDTGQGNPYATYAFGCHLAFLTVDTQTGKVSVSKIVAAHDVGKAINPQNVEGQIHGGVAMGIGFALMEEYVPGTTISIGDYHIPTAVDMPEIISIIVEEPEPTGPFGAKGVGEPALIPTAPAVINAIADASGKRIYRLPANPERVRGLMIGD